MYDGIQKSPLFFIFLISRNIRENIDKENAYFSSGGKILIHRVSFYTFVVCKQILVRLRKMLTIYTRSNSKLSLHLSSILHIHLNIRDYTEIISAHLTFQHLTKYQIFCMIDYFPLITHVFNVYKKTTNKSGSFFKVNKPSFVTR